jgi:hypothetical protein
MRRKEAGFVAAQAAIFVGVIALVALPAQSANQIQAETTSTSSGGQLAFLSGVSPQGLQLRVMLNSSSVQSHGLLRASVEVLNTVDRNVSFSGVPENQNISEWNGDDYFCPASFLLGFAVFQGHFAAGNISSAGPPLKIVPESVVYCAPSPIPFGAVTFLPGGDRAVVGSGVFADQATLQLNATTKYFNSRLLAGSGGEIDLGAGPGLVGYWNYSVPAADDMNFTSPGFVYFPPGEYTIAAADDWDQYVYATFVVEPSPPAVTFSSGATPDGLQLELTLNATTMSSDGAITGQMRVVNTLDQNVTVSVAQSQNLTTWSSYTDVCPSGYFMGYAVFPGHFTAGNISSAGPPLEMVPGDTGIICPPSAYLPPNPQSSSQITFLPGPALQTRANETFDIETVSGSFITPSFLVPDQLSVTTIFSDTQESCGCATPGLVGYYQDIGNGIFFPFSHGEYTLVAWDDWNQYVYVTFVVQG